MARATSAAALRRESCCASCLRSFVQSLASSTARAAIDLVEACTMVVATSLRLVCQGEHMRGDGRRVRAEHTAVRARRGGAGRGGEGVCNLFAGEAWPPVRWRRRGGGAAGRLPCAAGRLPRPRPQHAEHRHRPERVAARGPCSGDAHARPVTPRQVRPAATAWFEHTKPTSGGWH